MLITGCVGVFKQIFFSWVQNPTEFPARGPARLPRFRTEGRPGGEKRIQKPAGTGSCLPIFCLSACLCQCVAPVWPLTMAFFQLGTSVFLPQIYRTLHSCSQEFPFHSKDPWIAVAALTSPCPLLLGKKLVRKLTSAPTWARCCGLTPGVWSPSLLKETLKREEKNHSPCPF